MSTYPFNAEYISVPPMVSEDGYIDINIGYMHIKLPDQHDSSNTHSDYGPTLGSRGVFY